MHAGQHHLRRRVSSPTSPLPGAIRLNHYRPAEHPHGSGEIHADAGTLADFTVDLHVATRLLYETIDLAQAEARSLPRLLCCKKRLESVIDNVRGHPGTAIRDANDDILARGELRVYPAIVLISQNIHGLYREFPTIGHCIACVDSEIYNGGFKVVGIGLYRPETRASNGLNLDGFTQGPLQKFLQPIQENIQVDRLGVERLPTGER